MPLSSPSEQFTLLGSAHHGNVYGDYEEHGSGKKLNIDAVLVASLRHHHPGMTITVIPARDAHLIGFAAAGHAKAELDTSDDAVLRWRYYRPAAVRGKPGYLDELTFFGRYKYKWLIPNLDFIVYTVYEGYDGIMQYILFPPDDDETVFSHSKATDALLKTVADLQFAVEDAMLVYDGWWQRNRALWLEVQKTDWSDVILDKKMKETLTETVVSFFNSEEKYKELGVPWKRGLIFYGPAGNGKTLSLKALMHTLILHRPRQIVPLYVKSMRYTYNVSEVFAVARLMAPCLLIMEDIDTLVTETLRSYFFNEVDGLENNDGIMIIATTNHLDHLDKGMSKRPSRFDRKYKFGFPTSKERTMYCEFWRQKVKSHKAKLEFPEKLNGAIAGITGGFSFAYLKEAFVATLLALARDEESEDKDELCEDITDLSLNESEIMSTTAMRRDSIGHGGKEIGTEEEDGDDGGDEDIANLPLWIEMQKQVKILREDMDSSKGKDEQGPRNACAGNPDPPVWDLNSRYANAVGDPIDIMSNNVMDPYQALSSRGEKPRPRDLGADATHFQYTSVHNPRLSTPSSFGSGLTIPSVQRDEYRRRDAVVRMRASDRDVE